MVGHAGINFSARRALPIPTAKCSVYDFFHPVGISDQLQRLPEIRRTDASPSTFIDGLPHYCAFVPALIFCAVRRSLELRIGAYLPEHAQLVTASQSRMFRDSPFSGSRAHGASGIEMVHNTARRTFLDHLHPSGGYTCLGRHRADSSAQRSRGALAVRARFVLAAIEPDITSSPAPIFA